MNRRTLVVFLFLIFIVTSVNAAVPGNRIALVIGNASYEMMPLDHPVNDARAMTGVLKDAGFQVITVLEANLQAMQSTMLQFTASLNKDSTALVYYAGHGVQSNGRNYLLPVDAKLESEGALRFEGM